MSKTGRNTLKSLLFVNRKKPFAGILLAVLFLICGELALQVRSHMRYGQSVMNAVKAETTFVYNSDIGLKTLRPNAVIKGSQAIIESNNLGLRMPELPTQKPNDEIWIVISGASTVMGTYTKSNDTILSSRLEKYLNEYSKDKKIRVINAGIAGYTLNQQKKMLSYLMSIYEIDGIISYTGFNDISGYCSNKKDTEKKNYSLMDINLPKWLLSVKLLTMNTVKLREVPAGKKKIIDPSTLNLNEYRNSARNLIQQIKKVNKFLLVLNARSFRPEMPISEQQSLSQTALYYNPCFSLSGLHIVYDQHNNILKTEAQKENIPTLDLMKKLPGGTEYFGDATHFTDNGTDIVAKIIFNEIKNWIPNT